MLAFGRVTQVSVSERRRPLADCGLLAKVVEVINDIDSTEHQNANVSQKVDECCRHIEALVIDWRMEAILSDPATTLSVRCLVADHVMNMYAFIIGLKRLANRVDNINTVDTMTVRAARKIVSTLLDFDLAGVVGDGTKPSPSKYIFVQ